MTTFHCDKLCSDECCEPLRWALTYIEHFGKPLGSYVAGQQQTPTACITAWRASRDLAELAELMAIGLRVRGLVDGNHVRITHFMHPIKNQMIGIWWPRHCENADCDMVEARAKLLAIMQTAPDKSSRKACESILRGTQ